MLGLLLVAILTGGAVAVAWSMITDWFAEERRLHENEVEPIGELVKHYEANGQVSYVGGLISRRGTRLATKRWAASEVSDDVKAKFQGERTKISVLV